MRDVALGIMLDRLSWSPSGSAGVLCCFRQRMEIRRNVSFVSSSFLVDGVKLVWQRAEAAASEAARFSLIDLASFSSTTVKL
jgi:hypothetical protein